MAESERVRLSATRRLRWQRRRRWWFRHQLAVLPELTRDPIGSAERAGPVPLILLEGPLENGAVRQGVRGEAAPDAVGPLSDVGLATAVLHLRVSAAHAAPVAGGQAGRKWCLCMISGTQSCDRNSAG